jgi:hypothetical protein
MLEKSLKKDNGAFANVVVGGGGSISTSLPLLKVSE